MRIRLSKRLGGVVAGALLVMGATAFLSSGDVRGSGAAPVVPAEPASVEAVSAGLPKSLVVLGDTVRGAAGLAPEEIPFLSCVQANRFPQGALIVWRIKVVDPDTGAFMDADALQSVTLTLPDGSSQAFRYGPHPRMRTDDYFWTSTFTVPDEYPTGQFDFQVTAVDRDGRSGMFQQFNVSSSMVQIVPKGQR